MTREARIDDIVDEVSDARVGAIVTGRRRPNSMSAPAEAWVITDERVRSMIRAAAEAAWTAARESHETLSEIKAERARLESERVLLGELRAELLRDRESICSLARQMQRVAEELKGE